MALAFNKKAVKQITEGMTRHIQSGKVEISQEVVGFNILAELFPEEYVAYHTSTNKRNLYPDPQKFYAVMPNIGKLWAKKFIFVGGEDDLSERIKEAALFAVRTARTQYARYGVRQTGFLQNQLHTMLDGKVISNPAVAFRNITSDSIFSVLNTAAYAATSEVNAIYYHKIGGLMIYVARKVQQKYPDLGVLFMYNRADAVKAAGLRIYDKTGKQWNYDTPVLHIGSIDNVYGKWSQPGTRRRDRLKIQRKVARINETFGV